MQNLLEILQEELDSVTELIRFLLCASGGLAVGASSASTTDALCSSENLSTYGWFSFGVSCSLKLVRNLEEPEAASKLKMNP